MSASEAMGAALRLLARRGHSEEELRGKLRRKGLSDQDIAASLERCRQLGYIDDERFAEERARQLLSQGRATGKRLLLELQRLGIDESLAHRALEAARAEQDETALLDDLLDRRFPQFDYQSADDRQRRRVIHYFMRRGFTFTDVMDAVQKKG
ncbi:recombination regulator RecX [Desulfuromonas sp. KJ2020]|uniref:regulatory protein RecX n=1 Tax=Desulfuromonas sp. KJ2020 TaxID=2919173 RepID=UPI0020A6E3C3|nr:regulatory protein RecX [Desulfuromonas sp. KJ2020]MCP3176757.1 recombination regulator RecX [Desulfuromonas sp. KJ2020]